MPKTCDGVQQLFGLGRESASDHDMQHVEARMKDALSAFDRAAMERYLL
jgi:hypothetical protein